MCHTFPFIYFFAFQSEIPQTIFSLYPICLNIPFIILAYVLYDKGYDVWLGNARGTKPSQKHIKLSLSGDDRKQYWSFTLHEIGIYDVPACIDYILNQTKSSQLDYVGFSQGTTVFFIMASQLPQYNAKISNMIALAPVAYLEHSQNRLLNLLNKYYGLIRKVLGFFDILSVDADNRYLKWIAEYGCRKIEHKSPLSCRFILYFLDSTQINCVSLQFSNLIQVCNFPI